CIDRLQAAAVNAADLTGLAEAVPQLVSVLRYGTARKIPEGEIAALTRALAVEVIAGAAPASRNLDDDATARWRSAAAAFDGALGPNLDGKRPRSRGDARHRRARGASPVRALGLDARVHRGELVARPVAGEPAQGCGRIYRRLLRSGR